MGSPVHLVYTKSIPGSARMSRLTSDPVDQRQLQVFPILWPEPPSVPLSHLSAFATCLDVKCLLIKREDLTDVVDGLHMSNPKIASLGVGVGASKVASTEKLFDAERMSGRIHAKEAEGEPDKHADQMAGGLAGRFERLDWSFFGADL